MSDLIRALEKKAVVFGGGAFGTALATICGRKGITVSLLLRDPIQCRDINEEHENRKYLPGFKLPLNVTATTDAKEALQDAAFIIHAVPVQQSASFLSAVQSKGLIPPDLPIISTSKGIYIATEELMHEVIAKALNRPPLHRILTLSGPSFAKELMQGQPTAVVLAGKEKDLIVALQHVLSSDALRVYKSKDILGVELCGALKNVVALAAGALAGLGITQNTLAALVTRGAREIRRVVKKMGGEEATVNGLAGIGDLILTCCSGSESRNFKVGVMLGEGKTVSEALASMSSVAEGIPTSQVASRLCADHGIDDVPILDAVNYLVASNAGPGTVRKALTELMLRPLRAEEDEEEEEEDGFCGAHGATKE